jgi:hypothetical protein
MVPTPLILFGNEEKREAGGQGEFSVGLAARCRVTTSNVALKKAARS